MNQAIIVDAVGSNVMDISVNMTPDDFKAVFKEHQKVFTFFMRKYDSETGKADFSLVPGNGVVFYDTPTDRPWKDRIKQWASDRNLIDGSNPIKQIDKLNEEVDELIKAIYDYEAGQDQAIDDIKDAIGDIQVVLGVMCAQLGLDIDACREIAWEAIKDRKGKMVDGVFVKEVQGE